jgi:hypothetical protein
MHTMKWWTVGCVMVFAAGCASSTKTAEGGDQAVTEGAHPTGEGGAPPAVGTCTAVSTVTGDIELKSKPHSFQGETGIEFNVKDQGKNPYFLSVIILDGASDVTMVLTDLKTNQSSGFDGAYASNGKVNGTLLVRNATGDDSVTVTCKK